MPPVRSPAHEASSELTGDTLTSHGVSQFTQHARTRERLASSASSSFIIRVSTSCSLPHLDVTFQPPEDLHASALTMIWRGWYHGSLTASPILRPLDLDVLLWTATSHSLHLATYIYSNRTMPSPRSLSLCLTLALCSFTTIVNAVPPPSGVAPSPSQTYISPPPSEVTTTPETGSGQGQAVPLRKKNGVPLTNDDGTANLDSLHRQVGLVVAYVSIHSKWTSR